MLGFSFLLPLAVILLMYALFINGKTDAAVATSVVANTGIITPRMATLVAVVFNMIGVFSGTEVAKTVGKGIVEPSHITLEALCAAMMAIILCGKYAVWKKLPLSKSHALLSGVAGAGFAGGGLDALLSAGWYKVFDGMFLSLILGFSLALMASWLVIYTCANRNAAKFRAVIKFLLLLSCAFIAFGHGQNDGQKFIGVFATILLQGGYDTSFTIHWWTIVLCSCVMGWGTLVGGTGIVSTFKKVSDLKIWQGLVANLVSGSFISAASNYGMPLSTSHSITSTVAGAGAALGMSRVGWHMIGSVMISWIFTFPFCFTAAVVAVYLQRYVAALFKILFL